MSRVNSMSKILAQLRGVVVEEQHGSLHWHSTCTEEAIEVGEGVRSSLLRFIDGSILVMVRTIFEALLSWGSVVSADPDEAWLVLVFRQQDGTAVVGRWADLEVGEALAEQLVKMP